MGYTGKFRYAREKPDGAPRKLLDVSRLTAVGWQPRIPLREGLADAYKWYVENVANEYSERDAAPAGARPGETSAPGVVSLRAIAHPNCGVSFQATLL